MKGKTLLTGAVLCLVCATTFAAKYKVSTTTDEFNGHTSTLMDGNRLKCNTGVLGGIEFDAQKFTTKGGDVSFQIFVTWRGSTWMFIDDDRPLIALIDGKQVNLGLPASDVRRDTIGVGVYETAMYDIEPADLIALGDGTEVKIRVPGDKHRADCTFTADNTKRFRDFIAGHVLAAPESKPAT